MNKKFLSAILFGALMVTSTGTFVSCKDYDDDIDSLNEKVDKLTKDLSELQAAAGKYVTAVKYDAATGKLTVTGGNRSEEHTRRYHGANHQQHYFPCPRTLARLTGRNVPGTGRTASASRPDFGSRRTIPRRTISLRYHQLPRHLHTDRSPRHHPYRPGNTRNIGSNPVP